MVSTEYFRSPALAASLKAFNDATTLYFDFTKAEEKIKGKHERLFIPMVTSCNTATAIYQLLSSGVYTEHEAFMLMRVLLEKLVNFNYLRVASDQEVEKFFMYPYYRMYHNTRIRHKGVKGSLVLEMSGKGRRALKDEPSVKKALGLFSETNPRMSWTSRNFRSRVKYLLKNGPIKEQYLQLASMITYSDASEVLHASFYGDVFLTGAFTPGVDITDKERSPYHISHVLGLRLCVLGGLMVATAEAISRERGFATIITGTQEVSKRLHAALEMIDSEN